MYDSPRFLVYTDSLASRSRLDDLTENVDAVIFHQWRNFTAELAKGRARAVAIVVPCLGANHLKRLKRFRESWRELPAVLATESSPENVKAVNRLPEFDQLLVGEELATLPGVLVMLDTM